MTDPISFSSASPRFALPLLFSGQSQKEVTVNEAVLAADILLHPAIENVVTSPPTSPAAGQCWLIASGATGVFAGQTNRIAAWTEGGWRFANPREGMRAFDVAAGADRLYTGGNWQLSPVPANPSGGSVIDSEARAAIAALAAALRDAGVLS